MLIFFFRLGTSEFEETKLSVEFKHQQQKSGELELKRNTDVSEILAESPLESDGLIGQIMNEI